MPDSDLGAYLVARRAALSPADVGLPTDGHRRVAGLRREEVAALAGVNVDYYARLEQGRERRPSPQVLDTLARVFALDLDARTHLYRLAGTAPVPESSSTPEVDRALLTLLEQWPMNPAFVLDDALDVLAANELGAALHSGFVNPDNLARMVFLEPQGRRFYVEWEDVAADTVANLRMGWGRANRRGRPQAVVEELLAASHDFTELWERHEVRSKSHAAKLLDHPDLGRFSLDYQTFHVEGTADQWLLVYSATRDSPGAEALGLLGSLVASDQT